MKQGIKAFLITMGAGCCLSLGVIVVAILSDKPAYDKKAHESAKKIYDAACSDYAATHHIAAKNAESSVYADRDIWPILAEKTIVVNKICHSTDSARCVELLNRYNALNNEIERRIDAKMVNDAGLVAATDAMNKKLQIVEKYERDSAARAKWRAEPAREHVKISLRKIFTNENVH